MATAYKVCLSTHRIAMVDVFPYGAEYPYHAEIFQVRFRDNGIEMDTEPKCIAKAYVGSESELKSVIKSFGIEWRQVPRFIDALNVLVADYEQRCKTVPVFGVGE